MIIAIADAYWAESRYTVRRPGGSTATETPSKHGELAAAMDRTVRRLRHSGHSVVVQTVPHWTGDNRWEPAECPLVTVTTNRCGATMSTTSVETVQGPTRDVVARSVPRAGGHIWDTWEALCPEGSCDSSDDRGIRYRDASHITVGTGVSLTPSLTAAIRRVTEG